MRYVAAEPDLSRNEYADHGTAEVGQCGIA
jgi:hypothetical protein